MSKINMSTLQTAYKINNSGYVDKYLLNFRYQLEGSNEVFESRINFLLDNEQTPPLMTLTLIETNPQRMGLGKLMMYLTAQIMEKKSVPIISLAMNTPEENQFYTSVGFKACAKEIQNFCDALPDSMPTEEKEELVKQKEALFNKEAPTRLVTENTEPSVKKNFSGELLSALDKFINTVNTAESVIDENEDTIRADNIKSIVTSYKEHLEEKIKAEGYMISASGEISGIDPEKITPKVGSLFERYQIVHALHEQIKDKTNLDAADLNKVKESFEDCCKKRPDWLEKPFLERLADVLSLGIKPIYRAYFSKEARALNDLEDLSKPILSKL